MANKVNNWEQLLELANKDLEKFNAEIGVYGESGEFSITIVIDGKETEYASLYYEDELSDVINAAWSHAKEKAEKTVKKLVEAYLELTDAEKDEFLRLSGNN